MAHDKIGPREAMLRRQREERWAREQARMKAEPKSEPAKAGEAGSRYERLAALQKAAIEKTPAPRKAKRKKKAKA